MSSLEVDFGVLFRKEFANFPAKDQDAITQFVEHILQFGFSHLEGRNKPSDDVHKDDPYFADKVAYAQANHLWHYHIGIIAFDLTKPFGDRTSEYVLHYQKLEGRIKIVDYSAHPPFHLPTKAYLE